MRIAIVGVLVGALPFAAVAQSDFEHITGLASGAPPEIQAAALLKLAESPKLAPKQKYDLVERAFTLASQAKEPYPRMAIYGSPPDTSEAYRNAASALRLDRLSLQSRAIRMAREISPKLTRELAERLERPAPGKLSCEAGTVPDIAEYFEVIRDRDTQLAMADSPLELAALAGSVQSAVHAEAFAARLQAAGPDSRAFEATWTLLQSDLSRLAQLFPSQALFEGIRKYLVRNLTSPRCADSGHVFQTARSMAEWYNSMSASIAEPIRDEDLQKAPKMEGRAKVETYWDGAANQSLMLELKQLRFSSRGMPFTTAERRQEPWKQALAEFTSKLRAANPGFHQTTALLQALIEFTPTGEDRDRLFGAYLDALRATELQQKSPAEWLWRADSLYRMLERDPDRDQLKELFRNSSVPSLVLYAWFVENMDSPGMF